MQFNEVVEVVGVEDPSPSSYSSFASSYPSVLTPCFSTSDPPRDVACLAPLDVESPITSPRAPLLLPRGPGVASLPEDQTTYT